MRSLFVAVAIVALFSSAVDATCTGRNLTLSNIGFGDFSESCPYGYISDSNQGRCLTYRQAVNNFLYTKCDRDQDCGPLAISTHDWSTSRQIMLCGVDKMCSWGNTRAQNDTCAVNSNCYQYPTTTSATVKHGCDKSTKTCRVQTNKYVAFLGDRCNYDDYADTVKCSYPEYECDATSAGNCYRLLTFGEICVGTTKNCRYDSVCTGPFTNNRTCSALVGIGSQCYQPGLATECTQTTPAFCRAGDSVSISTCQPYQSAYQTCNSTYPCGTGLRCLSYNGANICLPPAYSNETCTAAGTAGVNICASGLTCINTITPNRCFAGNLTDPCYSTTTSGIYTDTCKTGLVCISGFCNSKVGLGQNCTDSTNMCLDGLYCYNKTCTAYQTEGQECDPTSHLNPLTQLSCNSTIHLCSRNKCIKKYSLSVDSYCAQDDDCDTSYCDPMIKKCTRRRMCSSSASDGSCTCVCLGGSQNYGQCIMNNCKKQMNTLLDCLNPLSIYINSTYYLTTIPASFAWLDDQSSFYSKCKDQHSAWVNCQGIMNKWGAPSVGLGDMINYDLATISASSSVNLSVMALVAFVMSAIMLL